MPLCVVGRCESVSVLNKEGRTGMVRVCVRKIEDTKSMYRTSRGSFISHSQEVRSVVSLAQSSGLARIFFLPRAGFFLIGKKTAPQVTGFGPGPAFFFPLAAADVADWGGMGSSVETTSV